MDERPTDDQGGPYTEPPHSTVDDWHGQELAREEELADELLAETGGEVAEAERRFETEVRSEAEAGR